MSNSRERGVEQENVQTWLCSLFSLLEEDSAVYAVLRFDATLFMPGSEIDLLVHPASLGMVLDRIRLICIRYRHLKVAFWRSMPRHSATIILVWLDSDDEWRSYYFDIRCGIHKRGHVLCHGSSLRHLTVWDDRVGVRRLKDEYERALLVIRNKLDCREPNERHIAIMSERSGGDIGDAMRYLGWHLADSGNPQILHTFRGRLRRVGPRVRYLTDALYGRIWQRTLRLNVVIYGPDGVGKSTQAQLIAEFLKKIGIRRVHIYHHLVEVGVVDSVVSDRKRAAKAHVYGRASWRWLASSVVLLSYLKKLMFVVGRLQPMTRTGHVFVHDRYLLDVFQKFYKTHGVRVPGLERYLSPLTPTEPLVVILQASPESVVGRTGELSREEVVAAYDLLYDCLEHGRARFGDWAVIDADQSIMHISQSIIEHVVEVQTRQVLGHRMDE